MISLGRILVVDDEQASYEMYRDVLSPEGYQVEWAADRAGALSRLQEGAWDVVVLDQRLNGERGGDSGIDLISEIVPTGGKVIVGTGYADPGMIDRAFRDGAYDYLEKLPSLPALLRVKVRNASEVVRERRLANLSPEQREAQIRDTWSATRAETDIHRKGKLLEDLMVLLFKTVQGFTHVDTRRKSRDEEIDIFIRNESSEPFWVGERSQYVIVECKNWSKPAGPNELIVFRDKVLNRGGRCRLGFFVAVGGFTDGFHSRSDTFRKEEVLIVPMGPEDLDELVLARDRNEVLKKFHARSVMSGNGH